MVGDVTVRRVHPRAGVVLAWVGDPEGDRAGAVLADLVGESRGVAPHAVRLGRFCPRCGSDSHGTPYALVGGRPGPHISLARAGGVSLVAVGDAPVGVDVEQVAATRFAGFPSVALHPAERADDPRERAVLWVRKEALLKAAGTGLATDPREVRVSAPDQCAAVVDWPHGPAWLTDLEAPDGLVAALAVLEPQLR